MSQAVIQEPVTKEWLIATFPIETQRVDGKWVEVGWKIAGRDDGVIITRMRVLEIGEDTFMAELGQGEASLGDVAFCKGVGIRVESKEHLDQLVAACRLDYVR